MDSKEKINHLREMIDEYDNQMVDLLVKRFTVSIQIGAIKESNKLAVGDPNREREIIDRLTERLKGKLNRDDISAIFGPVYHISKKLQKK
ncbi:MAG: chorismate mutase [Candidatus Marinimicrobia bacterium]|nr:chorismate mutase [Candidatus Neomarinimicrobiota bacterium]